MKLLAHAIILIQIAAIGLNAQADCTITLTGQVLDKATEHALEDALIIIEESGSSYFTDNEGKFTIKNICEGPLHLNITHLNCAPVSHFFKINADTVLILFLDHHAELLDEVVVHGHKDDKTTASSVSMSESEIKANAYKSLADIASNMAGVSSLKNGNSNAKPIVNGLYGNRLTIMNNGIAQSGQQWGNDHAPEIDAGIAHHISVIKGASALEYSGSNLGSVLIIDTESDTDDPHLKGSVNYIYNTNGRGHTVNTSLSDKSKAFNWQVTGTVKHSGDRKAPSYFLRNTGAREKNFSLQIDKDIKENWHTQIYLSSFNAEYGILRGAHVGNLTDLQLAIDSEVPYFTEEAFTDSISAPRQSVNHHLLKLESKHFLGDNSIISLKYGFQMNARREFDVRRSGRSDQPSLKLQQFTHFAEMKHTRDLNAFTKFKSGLQLEYIDNANLEGTGILPLIPDFTSVNPSAFLILQRSIGQHLVELGGRYDYFAYDVRRISDTLPREVIAETRSYHNVAVSAGSELKLNRKLNLSFNAGYVMRAPRVNELFSNGLHQGVSGIEEGSPLLKQEKSLKLLGELKWNVNKNLFIQTLAYHQLIDDYIYLQVQDEFRLTIRGAFPLYTYEQTDARLYGLDFLTSWQIMDNLKSINKVSIIRGRDLENDLGIVNLPADNIRSELKYSTQSAMRSVESFMSLEAVYNFRQSRISEEQDFLLPPDAYFLLNASAGSQIRLNSYIIDLELLANNLFNVSYRDYLNRLRYFADETGVDIGLRIRLSWGS